MDENPPQLVDKGPIQSQFHPQQKCKAKQGAAFQHLSAKPMLHSLFILFLYHFQILPVRLTLHNNMLISCTCACHGSDIAVTHLHHCNLRTRTLNSSLKISCHDCTDSVDLKSYKAYEAY